MQSFFISKISKENAGKNTINPAVQLNLDYYKLGKLQILRWPRLPKGQLRNGSMNNKGTPHRLLIIDDDSDYRKLLLNWLSDHFQGAKVVEYDPVNGVPDAGFDWSSFDVLLLDYDLKLGKVTGLDILQANHDNALFPSTIMLTSAGSEDVAVRAMKFGVTDYLRKERLDKNQLKGAVEFALEDQVSKRQRLGTMEEAIQIAQAEAKKVIAEFKSKYAKLRELEVKRVKVERERIEQDLQKKQEVLRQIEQERQKAQELRDKLATEMEKLKNSDASADVKEKLDITQQQLVLAKDGFNRIEQDYKQTVAAIAKSEWKQERGAAVQEKLEKDMENFRQEMEQHEKQLSGLNVRMKERLGILEDIARSKKESALKHDKVLLDGITSQLGKEE